jgi:hypothetical protein
VTYGVSQGFCSAGHVLCLDTEAGQTVTVKWRKKQKQQQQKTHSQISQWFIPVIPVTQEAEIRKDLGLKPALGK